MPQLVSLRSVAIVEHDRSIRYRSRNVPTLHGVFDSNVLVPGQNEELGGSGTAVIFVTRIHPDGLVVPVPKSVDAQPSIGHAADGSPREIWRLNHRILSRQIERYFLHEPLERFAVQFFSDGNLFCQISRVYNGIDPRASHVQILLVLVHPHFSHAFVVLGIERKLVGEVGNYSAIIIAPCARNRFCGRAYWEGCRLGRCDRLGSTVRQPFRRDTARS